MTAQAFGILVASVIAISGCSEQEASPVRQAPAAKETSTALPPSFINRVWVVAESDQVAQGSLRVFLSEGTLVMASPREKPALGRWGYDDGRLTITEEGLKYDVDIVELSADAFRIRIYSPGEPVEIRFMPADKSPT
jgi:hypothetical protein